MIRRESHLVRKLRSDRDGAHSERGTAHPAQSHQIIQNGLGGVDGNGKTDAGTLADAGKNHGVDANDFAVPVDKRAAGVTGIDGGIGLNCFVNGGAVGFPHRPNGTHNSTGHGSGEAERIPDGIDLVP